MRYRMAMLSALSGMAGCAALAPIGPVGAPRLPSAGTRPGSTAAFSAPEVEASEPLLPADLSTLRESASLETVLRLTASHSPSIKAARHRWLAANQKKPQVVALPDPRVSYTHWLQQMTPDFEEWKIGISQTIPWPEKLILAGRIADKDTQTAYLKYQIAARNAFADAKEAYFELVYIDRAIAVTEAVEKLYSRYAAVAAGGVDAGRTKLPETFRAESQRAQLSYDVILLREMRLTESERLGAIMGLGGAAIGVTREPPPPGRLSNSLDDLHVVALRNNQELQAAGVELEKAGIETELARRAPIPDLTIGVDYARTGFPKNPGAPTDDPVMFGIEVNIPLDLRKYRAIEQEARRKEQAAVADRDVMRLQTRSELAQAYFRLNNASRLVRLYRETLVPQARQAMQSAEELHRRGNANLTSVLETASTVHNFELARLRATSDFYRSVARIERVLGTAMEVTRSTTAPAGAGDKTKGENKP